MMEGGRFVNQFHLGIAGGCFMPHAQLFGHVDNHIHQLLHQRPHLTRYMPNLLGVDIFAAFAGQRFVFFVSPEKRGHHPKRGIERQDDPSQPNINNLFRDREAEFADVSGELEIHRLFEQIGFTRGFAALGTFPINDWSEAAKADKANAGKAVAELMVQWAQRRYNDVELSRIFLSHKGVNKPLVDKIDTGLRLLNLKTWFDRDDLAAGDALVRGVDNAFANCAAAVFFISGEYLDAGVIGKEIDRAIHEAAIRPEGFRIIPLVLRQHEGSDDRVPAPLKTLVWKTVDDVEVLPTILRSLPPEIQGLVRYAPPK